MTTSTHALNLTRWRRDQLATSSADVVAIEEPMELRLEHMWRGKLVSQSVAITMRTPGNDPELAVGFLMTEGIIRHHKDVASVAHCGPEVDGMRNVIKVCLHEHVEVDLQRLKRNFYTSSSCGVCGKASLEALAIQRAHAPAPPSPWSMSAGIVAGLPALMRKAQDTFEQTGGLHAAALFDAKGRMHCIREDVGRHNAVDKLIGAQVLSGRTFLQDYALMLSGRVSFELMQKAAMAHIPAVFAIGAPSSLACTMAESYDITLAGFVREDRLNIYHGAQRLVQGSDAS